MFVIETSGAVHVVTDLFGAFMSGQATALDMALATNSNVSIANNQSFTARFGNSWLCT